MFSADKKAIGYSLNFHKDNFIYEKTSNYLSKKIYLQFQKKSPT